MKLNGVQGFVTIFCLLCITEASTSDAACDSDEHLPCDDGRQCIPRDSWCDDIPDCDDDSDEAYCEEKSFFSNDPNSCKGKEHLFLCKNGQCYPKVARCDGMDDCPDDSDEKGCTSTTVKPSTAAVVDAFRVTTDSPGAITDDEDSTDNGDDLTDIGIDGIDVEDSSFSEKVRKGVKWLISVRKPNYGWGHSTARALVALGLSKPGLLTPPSEEASLMKKQLQIKVAVDFVRNSSQPVSLSRLSLYINAMLATCQDPRNFHGLNLVKDLRHRTVTAYGQKNNFVNPVALLTLCLVDESTESDVHKLMETIRVRAEEQRWIDMQYISVMALSCIVNNNPFGRVYAGRLQNAVVQLLKRRSDLDGSFGNIYSTALAVQALLSARGKSGWNAEKSMRYLANQQLESGSFGDLLSTYYILPVLAQRSLTNLKNTSCPKPVLLVRDKGLVPLETLLDYQGPRHYVRYSLYYGNPVEVSYSLLLHVPHNTTFFDVMRLAEHTDPKFTFQYEAEQSKVVSVYSIGNVPNDAEKGIYWQLYADLNTRHHARRQMERNNGAVNLQRYMHGVHQLIPKAGDHVAFWYRNIE